MSDPIGYNGSVIIHHSHFHRRRTPMNDSERCTFTHPNHGWRCEKPAHHLGFHTYDPDGHGDVPWTDDAGHHQQEAEENIKGLSRSDKALVQAILAVAYEIRALRETLQMELTR